MMKITRIVFRTVALSLLLSGAFAQAQITGTVTNKTTGKPAAGDAVVLVDVQAGMGEVARATTDSSGHYKLTRPGQSNYLVRVTHQGATYFIGAPEGGAAGDISVYDVAAKVDGVLIDEDVVGIVESVNGQLRVVERYAVHNSSMPPRTQWSPRSFEIVLPEEAVVEGASAQRPGGLPTSLKLDSDGPKGHYSFNFPIQPDDGEKSTLFQIEYMLPYSGKFTFHPQVTIPARTVWVMMPRSMSFAAGAGSTFISAPQEGLPTYVAKNAAPGKPLEFTVSGTGSIPRDEGGGQGGQDASAPGTQPGGGMANPINTPDPLSKYKWWILSGLALLLAAAAAFMLRKPATGAGLDGGAAQALASPTDKNAALLNALKEEIFALESDKIGGIITGAEYIEFKAALDTVLKRALKRQ
ncbi:MAG: carboxypeptidase regulatory-like domain-containing protein [Terracidiphilus sp.]